MMKTYEKINVNLDEQNMDTVVMQEELNIMLECDEYNDMMFYTDASRYENLNCLDE